AVPTFKDEDPIKPAAFGSSGRVMARMQPSQDDRFWNAFQGSWYRLADNRCVGEMSGNSMIWHVQWNMPEAVSPLEHLNDDVVMNEVDGNILTGRVRREGQVTILWSDGDVWLLK
ncbi:APX1, partial [Symbiodinium sp. KB8]